MHPDRPQLAFLQDHKVSGRLLMPGAALFDLPTTAGRMLTGHNMHQEHLIALLDCQIAAPILLSPGSSLTVSCRANFLAGTVTVSTPSSNGGARTINLNAILSSADPTGKSFMGTTSVTQAPLLSCIVRSESTNCTASASSPRGIADVAFEARAHSEGFLGHPAAVDCCMHVAASLSTPSGDGSPAALRIPSSVEAYTATPEQAGRSGGFASASVQGSFLDNAQISKSYNDNRDLLNAHAAYGNGF